MSQQDVTEQVARREVHGTQNLVVATAGLFDDRGLFDASGGVFPNAGGSGSEGAILKADTWTVNVAGTLAGVAVSIGDMVRSRIDTPGQTAGNWLVMRAGIQSIVAGDGIAVDMTDPANPIVSAAGGGPGSAGWVGPIRIYGLSKQDINFTADEGACSYSFKGSETAPIGFGATAADYQAAFEGLASVGVGKVAATGDPGAIVLLFDRSIVPELIVEGSTNSLKFEAADAVPLFSVSRQTQSVAIATPAVGDIFLDAFVHVIEPFNGSENPATIYIEDLPDTNGNWSSIGGMRIDIADNTGDNFSGVFTANVGRTFLANGMLNAAAKGGTLPTVCKISTPIYATLTNAGSPGEITDGVIDIYVCMATPTPAGE